MGALDPLALFGQFFEERNARPMNGAEEALVRGALDEAFGKAGAGAAMAGASAAPEGIGAMVADASGGEGA